jgi:hypothetical protein
MPPRTAEEEEEELPETKNVVLRNEEDDIVNVATFMLVLMKKIIPDLYKEVDVLA